MTALPYYLLPAPRAGNCWCDGDGNPFANGTIEFYVAGTDTPSEVFADADGSTSLGSEVDLDSDGRTATGIYLNPEFGGYKVILKDANGDVVWTQDQVESPADVFYNFFGQTLVNGHRDVTNGYTIDNDTDNMVTVAGVGATACVLNLGPAVNRGFPLTIKNVSTTAEVAVTPDGTETIDGQSGAYTMPVATSTRKPTITISGNSEGWWITGAYAMD